MEDLRQAGVDALAARAAALADAVGRRVLVGLAGPPAAGKSTLAAALVAALGPRAAVVGMDGFHLAQAELDRLGRADRKGAPDTFDAAGYVALLRRLRATGPPRAGTTPPRADAVPRAAAVPRTAADGHGVVYAPRFDRALEEPVAGAVAVGPEVDVVVTEGNYVLLWDDAAALLDARWYVDLDDTVRRERLVARHAAHGRTPAAAEAWVARSDDANAALVATTRDRADALVAAPRRPAPARPE